MGWDRTQVLLSGVERRRRRCDKKNEKPTKSSRITEQPKRWHLNMALARLHRNRLGIEFGGPSPAQNGHRIHVEEPTTLEDGATIKALIDGTLTKAPILNRLNPKV